MEGKAQGTVLYELIDKHKQFRVWCHSEPVVDIIKKKNYYLVGLNSPSHGSAYAKN